MKPVLTEAAAKQLEATVPFIHDERLAALCKDVHKNWEELCPILAEDQVYNAMIRTTTAVTMAGGSAQANVMPEKAWLVANNRLLPGQTLDDLWAHYKEILPEDIDVRLVKGNNPPAVQSTDTYAYKLIASIVNDKYPGITLIPSMLYGGTDSRYYCDCVQPIAYIGLRDWHGILDGMEFPIR